MTDAGQPWLAGAIDYAGLFPPASLPMATVVQHYAAYRTGPDAWALGRLVVPSGRLAECLAAAGPLVEPGDPWRIAALVADAVSLARLADFHAAHGTRFRVDTAEGRAATPAEVDALVAARPAGVTLFVELPLGSGLSACVERLRAGGAAAKIRMGGVTADAFPPVEEVVAFMRTCHQAGVAFKATAGLHHAWRGEYPLTYEPQAPVATMYGYLNMLAAAGALAAGADDATLRRRLLARGEDAVGAAALTRDAARAARALLAAFGSCSFREPVDELAALQLP